MRTGNRTVAKLKRNSIRHRESGDRSRPAHVSARAASSGNASFIRTPVFNSALDVVAYEILLVEGPITDVAIDYTGDRRLVVNSSADLDLRSISVDKPLHVTVVSPAFESAALPELLPEQTTVILGAGVDPSELVVTAIRELRARGFSVVLDDLEKNSHLAPLVRHVDAVRINAGGVMSPSLGRRIDVLKAAGVALAADRVGTYEEFRRANKLGFDHFQGSFFSRPDEVRKTKASTGQLAALELVSLLHEPDTQLSRIAEVIRRDVSLSYRVLKTVNSAQYALQRPLTSVEEAVMLVGTKRIAEWVGMMSMSQISNKPSELTRVAMVRARVCESLAEQLGLLEARRFYVVGLFSVVEALLDVPADQALQNLPLSSEIVHAITAGGGVMGEVLRGVVAFEEGDWSRSRPLGLGDETVAAAFRTAMAETDKAWGYVAV